MKILFSILVVFFCLFSCKTQPTEAVNSYSTPHEIGRLTTDLPRYSTLSRSGTNPVSTDLPNNSILKQENENSLVTHQIPKPDILPKQDSLVKDIYSEITELLYPTTEIITTDSITYSPVEESIPSISENSLIQTVNSAAFSWEIGIKITQIVDVRTFEEFKTGHIYDAVNMDVKSPSFVYQIQSLDKTSPVAVYSRSGDKSLKAAKILEENGFTIIYNLEGGLNQWIKDGKEIVK